MKSLSATVVMIMSWNLVFSQTTKRVDRVYEETGVMVFVDRNIVRVSKGFDTRYYLDDNDTNPDFFIPMKFDLNSTLCKRNILSYLSKNPSHEGRMFIFLNDCNFTNRQTYIEHDADTLQLDSILNYHGNKVFLMPVKIRYVIQNGSGTEDLFQHGNFRLRLSSTESTKIKISGTLYQVLEEAVLRDKHICK